MNFNKLYIYLFFGLSIFSSSCNSSSSQVEEIIDTQIIFSSRRWWNYDIFIGDIYGANLNHITKNRYIDFNPVISPDSKTLAFISDRDSNREIYLADLVWIDGYTQWLPKNLRNLTQSEVNEWTPVFSPVEEKIAFSVYFPENDNYDIHIMNLDGSELENLTNTGSYEKFPQFSPDGSFLIFQGWQKGKMELFFLNLLDKQLINLTRSINSNDIISHGNSFSANGESIVFTSDRFGNKDIFTMKINGDDIQQITTNIYNDYEPIYSPDGESIIFTSERSGNKEIFSYSISSGHLNNLTKNESNDWNSRFFPDGKKIAFQSDRDGNWEIYIMNVDGKDQTNFSNHPSTDYSYTIFKK